MGALAVGACPAAHSTPPDSAAQALYLDAFVNGVEKGLIIRVDQRAGRLYTSADELSEIGIRTQSLPLDADRQIALDAIPGLTHAYDERLQRIDPREQVKKGFWRAMKHRRWSMRDAARRQEVLDRPGIVSEHAALPDAKAPAILDDDAAPFERPGRLVDRLAAALDAEVGAAT